MNKSFKAQAQGGFTLIELIVVIVILGILAATALPKFANLSGDARFASVNAAKGAMTSASAIVHGKILVNPSAVDSTANTITVENAAIEVSNGYPKASSGGIMSAAGLSSDDYVLYTVGSGTKRPAVTGTNVALVPKSIDGTTTAAACFVTYTPATTTAAPTVVVTGSATACE